MSVGNAHGALLGYDFWAVNLLASTTPTAAANNLETAAAGWAVRFTARDARDIKSVYVRWAATTAITGTVTARIEIVDPTTGKPSGTPYDANATKTFTPDGSGTGGWQNVAFATLPTTGLTPNTEYCLVLLNATSGTGTATLSSHYAAGVLPTVVLQSATAGTRSSFAETAGSMPITTLVMEDDEEVRWAGSPFVVATTRQAFAANAIGAKFVVPSGVVYNVDRFFIPVMLRVGTPADDLKFAIYDASGTLVAGSSRTVSKNSLAALSGNNFSAAYDTPLALPAGTYRAVIWQAFLGGTSSNYYGFRSGTPRSASLLSTSGTYTSSANISAGTPTFTDAAEISNLKLMLDSVSTPAGGSPVLSRGILTGGRL